MMSDSQVVAGLSDLKLGEQAYGLGRFGEAAAAFQRALDGGADASAARFGLASALAGVGELERARAMLLELLTDHPRHVNALVTLGYVEKRAGNTGEAATLYRKALQLHPGHAEATKRLAELPDSEGPTPAHAATTADAVRTPAAAHAAASEDGSFARLLEREVGQLADKIPGEVSVSGRRRMSSFLGRFALAGAIGAAALLVGGDTQGLPDVVAELLSEARVMLAMAAALLATHAVLASYTHRYTVRSYRLDVERGVLFRRQQVIWFYKLTEVEFVETPLLSLVGTARLDIVVEGPPMPRWWHWFVFGQAPPQRVIRLIGVDSTEQMRRLADEIRLLGVHRRRSVKNTFL